MINKKIKGLSFIAGHWPLREELPTLIFLHGSACSAQMWREQLDSLADIANTIALDLPGHGGSAGPALESIPELAGLVASFIQENRLPQPIPCGLSMGSAVVLQLLVDYPAAAKAAILIGTGARLKVAQSVLEALEKDYPQLIEMLGSMIFARQVQEEVQREVTQLMLACPAQSAAADFKACNKFDVINRIGEINQPVLIITGDEDKMTPPKYAVYLEQNLKFPASCRLAQTGHMPPNEKPEQVNQAIRSFIANYEGEDKP